MKKKWPFILIILILIIVNLFYEFRRGDYSSDYNDNKIIDIVKKYQKESNDYNFQIINSILEGSFNYIKDKNTIAIDSIFENQSQTSLSNISNFSIQEIYKLTVKDSTINFAKVYLEQDSNLNTLYFIIKQDGNNKTYDITVTDSQTYENAKNNKVTIDSNFVINESDYNKYEYEYDFTKIAYRYINDYYLKYMYLPKEAYKIDDNYGNYNKYLQNRIKLTKFESDAVIDEGKGIEKDNILYFVKTNLNTFKINVYSPMNYKITIE